MTQIIDLGKLRFYFAGDYNPATVYELNDVVKYGGNSYVYINVVSGAGHLPTDVAYWGLMVEGLNFLGDWNNTTAYKVGDAVSYGAVVYVATHDNVGQEPDVHPEVWSKFSDSLQFGGVYDPATTYQPNDVVTYGGSTYIALQTTTGNVPTNTTYWDPFATGVRYRGNWAPATAYLPDDLVFNGVSTYITTQAFTSASTFNADYTAGKWTYFATGAADILPPITGLSQYGDSLTINNSGVIEWVNATNGVYVLYVSKAGNDSNPGTSLALPKLTIQGAVAAVPTNQKTAIFVKSGTYSELALPIVVPPYVAIIGDATRTTIVQPGPGNAADGITPNNQSQMWALSDGSLLNKLTFQGMTGWVPGSAPGDIGTSTPKGIFCGLNPASPIIVKSPYVIECSAFSTGGIGAYVNGDAHANGNRSILFHEFTGIHDNGVGIWCDNNAKSECVGVFTYYCYFGYATTNGGQIRSISGNNSYGTYGSFSSGYSAAETPITGTLYGTLITLTGAYTGIINPGDTITDSVTGATATAINVQVSSIYVAGVTGGTFNPGDGITASSGGTGFVSAYGGQQGYTLVLNNLSAEPQVGQSIQIAGDSSAYIIQAVSGAWVSPVSVISVALAQQKPSASAAGSAVTLRSYFSLCRITAHDFLNVGTGGITTTNYPNTPTQAPNPANRVIQTLPGRIYYVSADEQGNFNVGAYFAVNQATGAATLNANSFNLSGLTSLRLGSIGAQLGAQINEFSTDGTMSQNSPVKVPTQSAVVTYVGTATNTIGGTNPILIQTGQSMANTTYSVFSNQVAGTASYSLGSTAPATLTINSSTGVLSQSGANFTTGSYSVPILAVVGSTLLTKTITITVNGQIPLFPTNTFPSATLVSPSSVFSNSSAAATAITGTLAFTLAGGTLPSWCTLNPTTGVISGTAPSGTSSSVTYNFVVTATNGSYSVSKAFTWTFAIGYPVGQQAYTSAGSYTWIAPAAVTSISVVAVGGGHGGSGQWSYGGGAGGGLGWKNSITVTPGSSYTVVVGAAGQRYNTANYYNTSNGYPGFEGGDSYFSSTSTVGGQGGGRPYDAVFEPTRYINSGYGYAGGGYFGDGGGRGGNIASTWTCAGAGAGGYSGRGGCYDQGWQSTYGGALGDYYSSTYGTGGGGGIGLLGDTGSDRYGTYRYTPFTGYYASTGSYGGGGGHGPNGSDGFYGENPFSGNNQSPYNIQGGTYGAGGGGSGSAGTGGGPGGSGAVRIIWGPGRAFPGTLTSNQPTFP